MDPSSSSAAFAAALGLAATFACAGEGTPTAVVPGSDSIRAELVASGIPAPLFLTAPPGDDRLFVVEQTGRIRIIENGQVVPTPFLDITAKVASGGERGLLSVAFHPGYRTNGWFYVDYTDREGDTRVERYSVSADPARADPASARLVLTVEQPFANHNGGLLLFGDDGMLYVGLGDGGSGGDPFGHGQNRGTLLGSILRLDVTRAEPYAIPADNPFVGVDGARPEIWAYGLRNPWRFAFDRTAGMLYVADVGQSAVEEINAVEASAGGLNYGWNIMEGSRCYQASSCNRDGLILPVAEYGHDEGCSVTGGYVYRGDAIPELRGHYFYADFCDGWVRSFRLEGTNVTDQREWPLGNIGQVYSFGEDAEGELYILTSASGGSVYRIVRR
jgi:glucose/arabinose dehydrogenase